ncbi:hypothetical protein B0A67_09280 [Flavobacterium aquidurense]|nr:hypothetical protein B0A67_09280 [Flavobacterium aquidurense]SHH62995.1 Outer membrane protein beta-barrel family protein [Flavobacterium frigidimaris]
MVSGSAKWNSTLQFDKTLKGQVSIIYLAPDIIPQGKVGSRFSVDLGLKKTVQKGKGEVFLNATDIFNTLVLQKKHKRTRF